MIANSTIQLNSLDSWDGIDPIIIDPTGDIGDGGVDIEKVYVAYDDVYFYVRIDITGQVDSTHDKQLNASIGFRDNRSNTELWIYGLVFLNELQLGLFDNSTLSECQGYQQVMTYPGTNFLSWGDRSVVYRVRLSDIDFDLNGTSVWVRVVNDVTEDTTDEALIYLDRAYLETVTTVWPDQTVRPTYWIPDATIQIDGDMSDWEGVEPVFEDLINDVYGDPAANIEKAFMAQDEHAYYFRFDLLSPPVTIDESHNPQVRFEIWNAPDYDETAYWFTAWLRITSVVIQDISLFDIDNPGADTIKAYPANGFLAINGRHIEYRVMKADIDFEISGNCLGAIAIGEIASDNTASVKIE